MGTFIFDLDGTIAQIDHRRHLVEGEKQYWDKFCAECVNDTPNINVITILNNLSRMGHSILILSGRSSVVRMETIDWLEHHGVHYTQLIMRPENDYTPDEILKKQWLYELNRERIIAVFDDRDKVVKMWREEGLTCLQVAEGAF